jgi:hypothetical protein
MTKTGSTILQLKGFRDKLIDSCLIVISALVLFYPQANYAASFCQAALFGSRVSESATSWDRWNYSHQRLVWTEKDWQDKTKFYADAGINTLGVVYLDLRLVSKDGKERSTRMSGRKFIKEALDHFRGQGHSITAIKGWWVFRPDKTSRKSLREQVDATPNSSVNFRDYWASRKHENDIEAAKSTWTYKIAESFGFPVVSKVTESSVSEDYNAVFATFTPTEINLKEIKKSIMNGKSEALIPMYSYFYDATKGEDPNYRAVVELFKSNSDQNTLIRFVEQNTLIGSDFKSLGFEILGVEDHPFHKSSIFYLRVR